MNNCINCGIETINPKFCSRSCSVSHTNKFKSRSKESRLKTSMTLKSIIRPHKEKVIPPKYSKVFHHTCSCGVPFYSKTKSCQYCHICRTAVRIKNGLRSTQVLYNGVYLDSSWELKLAKHLDDNNIKWTRPSFITYSDIMGNTKKYFPDFYLPKLNIYLDPKNPYGMIKDKHKLQQVMLKVHLVAGSVDDIISYIGLSANSIGWDVRK